MKAAVLGASGYTGMVMLRILENHPEINEILPVSSTKAGEALIKYDKGFGNSNHFKTKESFISIQDSINENPDVVFSCLPHLTSAEVCEPFIGKSVIVDLSADFRLKNEADFIQSYETKPPKPQYQKQAIYGLPELYRDEIKSCDIIANPGFYPTASLLPIAPFASITNGDIIIDALSGISGAGKKLNENLLFCERYENAGAYLPGQEHRHATEIQKEIRKLSSQKRSTYFTPHLIPVKRGMTATIYMKLENTVSEKEAGTIVENYYSVCPFIRFRGSDIPQSADTMGSNRCDIGLRIFDKQLILFSSIDNLLKGASGMAVQNMNIRFGLNETAGLPLTNQL